MPNRNVEYKLVNQQGNPDDVSWSVIWFPYFNQLHIQINLMDASGGLGASKELPLNWEPT